MNGIILVNKETDYTSHDVVAKLRGMLRQKKIGHTGTLDPQATGLLPVCLGNATRVCELLTNKDKEYIAGIRFGVETDTQDIYGEIVSRKPATVAKETFLRALSGMLGEQEQLTPMFSARKVGGRKLCDLARQGVTVERSAKKIRVLETELLSFEEAAGEAVFRVVCSTGTYVRTLCHDLGQRLGCGACMSSLRRTRVGDFSLAEALTLSEIERRIAEGSIADAVRSVDSLFPDYPQAEVCSEEGRRLLANGNPLRAGHLSLAAKGRLRIYEDGEFRAIYEGDGGIYRPVKMFLPERKG